MNYKYHLLKYNGPSTRLTCPNCGRKRCFVPYVDDNDQIVGNHYGRCNHESSCGYVKYPPSEPYEPYTPQPHYKPLTPKLPCINTIPLQIVNKTLRPDLTSDLTAFLLTIFDRPTINKALEEYRIGITKNNDTVFYQIDNEGRFRTGKIMKYNRETGHRIKDGSVKAPITWVHSLLKQQGKLPQNWELTQCLFGEHLLSRYPDKDVILVEAEKTALIGTLVLPHYIWVATGGKSQLGNKINVLEGRRIIAFPDVDGYDTWLEKISERPYLNIFVSDYLQRIATDEDRQNGIDIADILLRWQGNKPCNHSLDSESFDPILIEIQKYLSPQYHSETKALIEDLDWELISITRPRLVD